MAHAISLTEIKALARQLSWRDKVRLIQWIAPQIERDLQNRPSSAQQPLRGLWRELDLTETDIDQARKELWADFPREPLL